MKNFLLLCLMVLGVFFTFGCGGTNNQPIENPVANTPPASQTLTAASQEKSKICHLDPDTGTSKVIEVSNSSLADHFAQGDCLSSLPKGTPNCSCAPAVTSFTATPDT